MKVAVFGLKIHRQTLYFLHQLYKIIQQKDIEVLLHQEFLEQIRTLPYYNNANFSTFTHYEELQQQKPDVFLTFGGDGTILKAITYIRDLQIPIIGINTGRLGFLASINKKDFLQELDDFLKGDFIKSKRSMLQLSSKNSVEYPFALNEFTISRKETTSMITIDTYINNTFLNSFWADGLIISTPTGSTGYSLSCGGPIISPENKTLVITPIAPHNLNVRPFLIEDDVEIKLKVKSRVPEFSLSLDSRLYSIPTEQEIILKKATYPVILGQSKNYDYFSTLREKLNWGYDLRN